MFAIDLWIEINKYYKQPLKLGLVCRELCFKIRNPAYLNILILNLELCKKSFKNTNHVQSKFNTLVSIMQKFDALAKYDIDQHYPFRRHALQLYPILKKLEKYIDYNVSYNTFSNSGTNTIYYKKFDQLAVLVSYEYDTTDLPCGLDSDVHYCTNCSIV